MYNQISTIIADQSSQFGTENNIEEKNGKSYYLLRQSTLQQYTLHEETRQLLAQSRPSSDSPSSDFAFEILDRGGGKFLTLNGNSKNQYVIHFVPNQEDRISSMANLPPLLGVAKTLNHNLLEDFNNSSQSGAKNQNFTIYIDEYFGDMSLSDYLAIHPEKTQEAFSQINHYISAWKKAGYVLLDFKLDAFRVNTTSKQLDIKLIDKDSFYKVPANQQKNTIGPLEILNNNGYTQTYFPSIVYGMDTSHDEQGNKLSPRLTLFKLIDHKRLKIQYSDLIRYKRGCAFLEAKIRQNVHSREKNNEGQRDFDMTNTKPSQETIENLKYSNQVIFYNDNNQVTVYDCHYNKNRDNTLSDTNQQDFKDLESPKGSSKSLDEIYQAHQNNTINHEIIDRKNMIEKGSIDKAFHGLQCTDHEKALITADIYKIANKDINIIKTFIVHYLHNTSGNINHIDPSSQYMLQYVMENHGNTSHLNDTNIVDFLKTTLSKEEKQEIVKQSKTALQCPGENPLVLYTRASTLLQTIGEWSQKEINAYIKENSSGLLDNLIKQYQESPHNSHEKDQVKSIIKKINPELKGDGWLKKTFDNGRSTDEKIDDYYRNNMQKPKKISQTDASLQAPKEQDNSDKISPPPPTNTLSLKSSLFINKQSIKPHLILTTSIQITAWDSIIIPVMGSKTQCFASIPNADQDANVSKK